MIHTFFQELGSMVLFFIKVLKLSFKSHDHLPSILHQIIFVSTRSFATVLFAGGFVGAILVLQFNLMLSQYDAQSLLGGLSTSAVVRDVGPLIISFLLAGKIGAFTAAELGTMRVTEQIDAIECLGTHPLQYLVLPRWMGIIFSSVFLLTVGLTVSVLGAMAIASILCGVNVLEYASSIPKFTTMSTVFGGLFKSVVYSTIVATVSCYQGFTTKGGARGVGEAVTRAAVSTNLYIVVANYLTSHFLDWIAALHKLWTGAYL